MDRLLTLKETGKLLNVSKQTLQRWDNSGKLIAIRTEGGHRRYKLSDIEKIMNMKDKEQEIFKVVAAALRKHFEGIYVIGTEMSSTPPKFPAVSFVQTNNAVRGEHSTFKTIENVVTEDYKAEVFSNLSKGKEAQTKEIIRIISDVMSELGYERTFCEIVPNTDATISRRMSRYRKNNVI